MHTIPTQRYKVLIPAYACNPYKGSEEGVGWGWVKAIAPYHDLYVITAEFHRADIEKAVAESPADLSRVRFFYVSHKPWHYAPTPKWVRIEMSCLKPLMNLAYLAWLKDAHRLGVQMHREHHFDLVHQLTYVGYRFPGHLWKLDIPFVWGPVAGLRNTPWRFLPSLGIYGCLYYAARNTINSLQKRCLRRPKQAFRKAGVSGAIITATQEERQNIRRWYGQESDVICEIGPPATTAAGYTMRNQGEPLRLAWSGLHTPGKALPFLLRALAGLAGDVDWHLDVLGDGPCREGWQNLACKLCIDGRCVWHGRMPRDEAVALVHNCHVFVITSIQDLTSSVLLEALSQGVPVICPNHCGFRDVVTDDCGLRIPAVTPKQLESDLAAAIRRLADDEHLRRRLAQGALQRIEAFSWAEKGRQVDAIYRRVMSKYKYHDLSEEARMAHSQADRLRT